MLLQQYVAAVPYYSASLEPIVGILTLSKLMKCGERPLLPWVLAGDSFTTAVFVCLREVPLNFEGGCTPVNHHDANDTTQKDCFAPSALLSRAREPTTGAPHMSSMIEHY